MIAPYYQEDGITLYCGDCREILPQFPDKSFDLCLTDPPYGLGVEYDSFDDTPENVRLLIDGLVDELRTKAVRVALTCATRQICYYPEPTWILSWINRAGSYRNPWGFTCWQPILVYGKDPFLEKCLGSRPDIIDHSETSEKFGHPVTKPIRFWKKLLSRCSINGDVLDPMVGSGTTLVAAKQLGRKAVGIEISEKYCEIAVKRLAQMQLNFK